MYFGSIVLLARATEHHLQQFQFNVPIKYARDGIKQKYRLQITSVHIPIAYKFVFFQFQTKISNFRFQVIPDYAIFFLFF